MAKQNNKKQSRQGLPPVVFELMDEADGELIANQLQGKMMDVYVYHIKDTQKNLDVYGLSTPGTDDACRYMSQKGEFIRVEDMPQVMADEEGCLANVIARRYIRGEDGNLVCADTALGTKYEPRIKERRDGTKWADRFYREVAVSKAQRNAKLKLIPESVKLTIIEKYKKIPGKSKQLQTEGRKSSTQRETHKKGSSSKQGKQQFKPSANFITFQNLRNELMRMDAWENDKDFRGWLKVTFRRPVSSTKELSEEELIEGIKEMRKMKKEIQQAERQQSLLLEEEEILGEEK